VLNKSFGVAELGYNVAKLRFFNEANLYLQSATPKYLLNVIICQL
jgi:hypothetical protein